jgi:TolB-like protein
LPDKGIQRRLAAILMADVVGYSRLMATDEVATLEALKRRRKDILAPIVKARGGRVVKLMGDGVLVEFASAVKAVEAAIELQEKFAKANDGVDDDRRILIRIGINLGDVISEGSDIYGDGVNIAARLETLAEPGGICVSSQIRDASRGKVQISFTDMGDQSLKNISVPVRVYRIAPATGPLTEVPLALPDKPSIAVLPFDNMSGDPEQQYFADGIVEEIITALSRIKWLFVIARNSSFIYKGRAVDVKQVGRELGVRYVLEGSVRRAVEKIRITGQLIDATNGAHIWADRFAGGLSDVFALQDQVTASVVGAIMPKLEQAEIERAILKPTENLDAYDCYLRGQAAMHEWTLEGNTEALRMFNRAIEIDPRFATPYGMLARCYCQRKTAGWTTDHDREIVETKRVARRAVELGKDDSVALCTAGFGLAFVVGELDEGDILIEHALAINPNLAWAWYFSGFVKGWLGKPDVAIERSMQALRLSPHDPYISNIQTSIAQAHFFAGRDQEALTWSELAISRRPNQLSALRIYAASSSNLGLQEQAEKAMESIRRLDPTLRMSKITNLLPLRREQDLKRLQDALRRAGLPD